MGLEATTGMVEGRRCGRVVSLETPSNYFDLGFITPFHISGMFFQKNYFRLLCTQLTRNIGSLKVANEWIRTADLWFSEATALPTEPQPLPY